MSFLLDTNICSVFLRRPGPLTHRFMQYGGGLNISTIVLQELLVWAHRRPDAGASIALIYNELLSDVNLLSFDQRCAEQAGDLIAKLLNMGIVVPSLDLMIAATALVHDLTVVTQNLKHFVSIPDLRVENWLGT